MTAIEIREPGGPDVLVAVERPMPQVGPEDVLIKVIAAGVNRPDVAQRLGRYPPPPGASDIPGLEVSGTVTAIGDRVDSLRVGDRVCALLAGGGYAEYAAAPAVQCLPIPRGVEPIAASGIPETAFTVWTNVFDRGRLKPGESILVHGGSSGIGTTAIQMARAFGARVLTTAGSAAKCAALVALGAERAVNYKIEDFVAAAKEMNGGDGVDVILDIIGAAYLQRNLDALALEGRLVHIGQQGGAKTEINLGPVLRRRLTITGSTLRARTVAEKGAIARQVQANVWPLFESGAMKVIVHATFPLGQAADAHRVMESSEHIGKLILTI
jgi:NADPH2:quinone reductase